MTQDLRLQLSLHRTAFHLNVNLTLPGQGITVLFGPSGSGKTTVLRCVAGLETTASGVVQVGSEVWQDSSSGVCVPVWRRDLGFVFQEASLFEHLDVRRNIEYGMQRTARQAGHDALDASIDLLGIGALLKRSVAQLSGGERQRVAIARALAMRPRLLLLDEPMAALDHARRQEILPWLERLRDELKIPMLYVTHSADEVARLAEHLVVMDAGRVRASGPATEVLSSVETPVIVGEDAGTLIHAVVAERDPQWHLLRAAFSGGSFWVRDGGQALGQAVRLRVLARDVSIQLQAPAQTSIQNHLQGVVESVVDGPEPSQALLRLRCGQGWLLARLTRRAVHALELVPGKPVWAQIKAVAVTG